MPQVAKSKRHNRTITVDFHDETTYSQLRYQCLSTALYVWVSGWVYIQLGDGKLPIQFLCDRE